MLDGGDNGGKCAEYLAHEGLTEEKDAIGHNVKVLFAEAVKRMKGMANGDAH